MEGVVGVFAVVDFAAREFPEDVVVAYFDFEDEDFALVEYEGFDGGVEGVGHLGGL